MRVVIDTNVLVSRYLTPTSSPARVFRFLEDRRFELVVSTAILDEFDTVLRRPELSDRHGLTEGQVGEAISAIADNSFVVAPTVMLPGVTADPKDDKFVECAVAGEADLIVSGDRHLLELGSYRGIRIVTPAAFLVLLELEFSG